MVFDRIYYSKFVLILVIGSAAFTSACDSSAQNRRPAEAPAPEVVVTQVEAGDVPVISEYPAQTYARNTVEVRGRVDGYIDKWLFHPGQEVRAGDVLYVLDLRPYEAAVEQAKGNVAQSEADLEFARKQVALLQAEANLAAAQANLLKAQQDYDRLTPLVKDEAAAQQELDTAVAALHAGEANV
ncbi:MAG TPA: biotin/lipoyl-binding protein, partial [Bryobacteraceae bacterium]|nr:biotin/lipoyl-binding protein [Bryobacteraceae bacterium]